MAPTEPIQTSQSDDPLLVEIRYLRKAIDDLTDTFKCAQVENASFREASIRQRAMLEQRQVDMQGQLTGHAKQIEVVEDAVEEIRLALEPLKGLRSFMIYIGTGLAGLILLLLWGILTHSVAIHVP